MEKYKTIKEVQDAVKSGELDESKLTVVMDNDCSNIYNGPCEDIENCIFNGEGYYDTEELWPLVFPKATVEWC